MGNMVDDDIHPGWYYICINFVNIKQNKI